MEHASLKSSIKGVNLDMLKANLDTAKLDSEDEEYDKTTSIPQEDRPKDYEIGISLSSMLSAGKDSLKEDEALFLNRTLDWEELVSNNVKDALKLEEEEIPTSEEIGHFGYRKRNTEQSKSEKSDSITLLLSGSDFELLIKFLNIDLSKFNVTYLPNGKILIERTTNLKEQEPKLKKISHSDDDKWSKLVDQLGRGVWFNKLFKRGHIKVSLKNLGMSFDEMYKVYEKYIKTNESDFSLEDICRTIIFRSPCIKQIQSRCNLSSMELI
uniref:Phosphoprotein n=1 Tax=Mavingoni virus TaxID=2603829 RepID=A0A5B9BK89_9RHAB|nr:phosphoprotein [Mavingoni virus]